MQLLEPVSSSSRVLRRADVHVEETEDGWLLVDTASDERIALSPTAVQLWKLLDGEHTVGNVAEALGQPLIDVIELIRRLRAGGLAGDAPRHSPTEM